MSKLHERGLLMVDPLKIGFQCADNYALIDNKGIPSTNLYCVGALWRAKYWEATAAPDLRNHIVVLVPGLFENEVATRSRGVARRQVPSR